jgi:hypothetical protein
MRARGWLEGTFQVTHSPPSPNGFGAAALRLLRYDKPEGLPEP